jgi:hypothetical protein
VENINKNRFMYFHFDQGKNKIGVEGIKRLMKADWGKIE